MRLFGVVLLTAFFSSSVWSQTHIYEKAEGTTVLGYPVHEYKEATTLGVIFASIAGKSHLRGTHSKGVCAQANFEVKNLDNETLSPEIKARLQTGLFSRPGVYPARLRFANAASKIQPDQDYDGRALSFAVQSDLGRQDFVVQNSPIFPIPSLSDFVLLIKFIDAKSHLETFSEEEQARIKYMLKKGQTFNPSVKSYVTETYWSGTAYALGEKEAVKYVVTPCSTNKAIEPSSTPDYLQVDLLENLKAEKPACFDFRVQLLKPDQMTHEGKTLEAWEWVEDPTLEWKDAEAPSYSVATLTLKPEVVSETECNDSKNRFSVMEYTSPEHRGLGRINRGRTTSEVLSSVRRALGGNTLPSESTGQE